MSRPRPPVPAPPETPPERQARHEAEALHRQLCERCLRMESDLLSLMDLLADAERIKVWEFHGYSRPADYYEQAVGLRHRTVLRLLAIQRAVARLPEGEQPQARRAIARIGTHKAAVIAPLIGADEAGQDWRALATQARGMTEDALQARVSQLTGAKSRGAAEEPGERFLRAFLGYMPPERRDWAAKIVRLCASQAESRNPLGAMIWILEIAQRELGDMGVEIA